MNTLRTLRRKCIRLANQVLARDRRLNRRLPVDETSKQYRALVLKHRAKLRTRKIASFERIQQAAA